MIFARLKAGVAKVVLTMSMHNARSWAVMAAVRAKSAVSAGMAALDLSGLGAETCSMVPERILGIGLLA